MTIKTKITVSFGAILMLLVTTGVVVLANMAKVHREFTLVVEQDAPVLANANHLLKLVVDMETGQRGFCITQKEEYLDPYHAAQGEFKRLLAFEKMLVRDLPSQVMILETIEGLVRQWQEEVAKPQITVARRVALQRDLLKSDVGLEEVSASFEAGTGKALLDRIRMLFAKFTATIEAHTAQRYASASLTTLITKKTAWTLVLFSAIFTFAIAVLSTRGMIHTIGELLKGTKAVGDGDLSYRIEDTSPDELGELAGAFNRMAQKRQETESELNKEIIERKHAQRQLTQAKDHAEDLNEQYLKVMEIAKDMAARAESASAAKSEFLAKMSHEIRTPMNAILGFSDLLTGENLTGQQKRDIDSIRESARNLLGVINDILDFSKIEAGQLQVEMMDCSLGQLLTSVESMMRPLAEKKAFEFKVTASQDLPTEIHSDPVRLRQCLINLVNNAIKFTEDGHVHLNVFLEHRDNQPFVRFDVEDSGIGIPEDKQESIFMAFTQADNGTTRKYGGSGLGLSITKQFAEFLGGDITVSSQCDKGSVFSLVIPVGLDISERSTAARGPQEDTPKPLNDHLDRPRFFGSCLVAEDVPANQLVIERFLGNFGLEVMTVADGRQAVEQAQAQSYDLIFMDMHMPKMNGYDATKALRQAGLKMPIVALTASAMIGDDRKCFDAGCTDYLSKPIDQTELCNLLGKYLSQRSHEDGSLTGRLEAMADEIQALGQSIHQISSDEDGPVVDWAKLVERGMSEEILKEIVPMFLSDKKMRLMELGEAIKNADAEQVKLCAHAINGGAGNIGASRLSRIAHDLERKASQADLSDAAALLDRLQEAFAEFESFVSRSDWIETAQQQCQA